jgi:hypothetical protein
MVTKPLPIFICWILLVIKASQPVGQPSSPGFKKIHQAGTTNPVPNLKYDDFPACYFWHEIFPPFIKKHLLVAWIVLFGQSIFVPLCCHNTLQRCAYPIPPLEFNFRIFKFRILRNKNTAPPLTSQHVSFFPQTPTHTVAFIITYNICSNESRPQPKSSVW